MDNDNLTDEEQAQLEKERRIKQLAQVICICKGIPLHRVLKGLDGSKSVEDVNKKTGCGSGGCQGQRCGPRIKVLLKKAQEREQRKKEKKE